MKIYLFSILFFSVWLVYSAPNDNVQKETISKPVKFVRPPGLDCTVKEKPKEAEPLICPKCSGTGKVKKISGKALIGENCSLCDGVGKIQEQVKADEKNVIFDTECERSDKNNAGITKKQLENLKKALKQLKALKERFDSYRSINTRNSYGNVGYYTASTTYYDEDYEEMEEGVEELKNLLKENKAPSTVVAPVASIQTKFSHRLTPAVTYPETRRLSKVAIKKLEEFCKLNEEILKSKD